MKKIEDFRVGEVILAFIDGEDIPATITSIDGEEDIIKVNIIGTAKKEVMYVEDVFKVDRKAAPWNKNDTFPKPNQKIEYPGNGYSGLDKIFLVKIGNEFGHHYELARYNEWGWHYATRNTQDMIFDVFEWKELEI